MPGIEDAQAHLPILIQVGVKSHLLAERKVDHCMYGETFDKMLLGVFV